LDAQKIVVLQNEFLTILKLARDLEDLLCHTMDWILRRIGYTNIAIYVVEEDSNLLKLGAYMKYTIPGDGMFGERLADCFPRILSPKKKERKITFSEKNNPDSRRLAILNGQSMAIIRCSYLVETLALISVFRPEKFTTDNMQVLRIIQAIFPIALARIMRGDDEFDQDESDFTEDDQTEQRKPREKDDADWWKGGRPPPF
jgi:hypothetical protein